MNIRPVTTIQQPCRRCGTTTLHHVAVERDFELVARCSICGQRPRHQFPPAPPRPSKSPRFWD